MHISHELDVPLHGIYTRETLAQGHEEIFVQRIITAFFKI